MFKYSCRNFLFGMFGNIFMCVLNLYHQYSEMFSLTFGYENSTKLCTVKISTLIVNQNSLTEKADQLGCVRAD